MSLVLSDHEERNCDVSEETLDIPRVQDGYILNFPQKNAGWSKRIIYMDGWWQRYQVIYIGWWWQSRYTALLTSMVKWRQRPPRGTLTERKETKVFPNSGPLSGSTSNVGSIMLSKIWQLWILSYTQGGKVACFFLGRYWTVSYRVPNILKRSLTRSVPRYPWISYEVFLSHSWPSWRCLPIIPGCRTKEMLGTKRR